jgi:uncharacterized protein (TIRG00374 family)
MRRWRLWIGIAISVACLVLALVGIEWDQVAAALLQADWRYLIPAGGALALFLVTRSVRWRILLGPEITLADAFAVTNIGYLISNVFPFRLGDPARAVAMGIRGKVKVSAALSTVVVERVLDMLMVVLLLAVTVPSVGYAGWTRSAGIVAAMVTVATLSILTLFARRPDWGHSAIRYLLRPIRCIDQSRWADTLAGLLDGLTGLGSLRSIVGLLVWSVVVWASSVAFYFSVLRAFTERPSLIQASFLTCAIGLSMALPSSPGAIGVFQTVARYALQLPFGVPAEQATAIAFGSHAFAYVAMCLLGLAGLAQQQLSWKRLRQGIVATVSEE